MSPYAQGIPSISVMKNQTALQETQEMWETRVGYLDWEDYPEKEMAMHSSILAWEIPWTEQSAGLQSKGRKESDMTE